MRCFLAALLLLASPAYAHKHKPEPPPKVSCAPAKQLVQALIRNDFLMTASMAVGDLPGAIFVNPSHEYLIIELRDDKACIIGGGVGFYLVRERKA